jgi:hypothetical protein
MRFYEGTLSEVSSTTIRRPEIAVNNAQGIFGDSWLSSDGQLINPTGT